MSFILRAGAIGSHVAEGSGLLSGASDHLLSLALCAGWDTEILKLELGEHRVGCGDRRDMEFL